MRNKQHEAVQKEYHLLHENHDYRNNCPHQGGRTLPNARAASADFSVNFYLETISENVSLTRGGPHTQLRLVKTDLFIQYHFLVRDADSGWLGFSVFGCQSAVCCWWVMRPDVAGAAGEGLGSLSCERSGFND